MVNVPMHCKRHAATFKSKHRKKEPTDINALLMNIYD
jgi:hypothetical protein